MSFLPLEKLRTLSTLDEPEKSCLDGILSRAAELKGLPPEEAALLLAVKDPDSRREILAAARRAKEEIYGSRIVLFAPVYTGNSCVNNCLYCGFRTENSDLHRRTLSDEEVVRETELLLSRGYKRILLLWGESPMYDTEYMERTLAAAYSARWRGNGIRRINVEIAPLEPEGFKALKRAKIGTYTCFQETYDPELYRINHPRGPKSDYQRRLFVMDKAMESGIDDVGLGALFGLGDFRFEVLSLLYHAAHLEEAFGCGPHTVSVPRIEPAVGSEVSMHVPRPVSDEDFKLIIAVLRLSLPYTGIILSTRENAKLRNELFGLGVSQVSAGSKTDPGGYGSEDDEGMQFSLGDRRNLDEVIFELVRMGLVPSFCTGCYRMNRVEADFMDLAKPGLIKEYCLPNGLLSFAEYLHDFASPATRGAGFDLIGRQIGEIPNVKRREEVLVRLGEIAGGKRDIYY